MKFITFTEECIMDEECSGWIAGRMEVYDFDVDPSYSLYEKRFFTPKRKEFQGWRWVWEGQHLTDLMLSSIERKLEEFNELQ